MVTLSTAALMSWLSDVGLDDAAVSAFLNATCRNCCWRVMRPRSARGSSRHLPSVNVWKCRDRAKARAWVPSSVTQPGVRTSNPVDVSRDGTSNDIDTPPMASTRLLKPSKLTST